MKNPGKLLLLLAALGAAFAAGSWKGGRGAGEPGAGRKVLYWVDPMHPAYRSDKPGTAPDCGMRLEPVYADETGRAPSGTASQEILPFGTVRVSPARQQLIGVRTVAVERAPSNGAVRLVGRVVPDEARVYRATAANDWWAKTVSPATTGSAVRKGDLLATMYPPGDLIPLIQGYFARLDGASRIPAGGAPMDQVRLGQWNVETFVNSLRNQGITGRQLEELTRTRTIPTEIEVRTPMSGIVLARGIAPEQRADKGAELFRIADLSRVWVLADLFGADAQAARPGLPVKLTLPDQNKTFQGRISQVKPVFDGSTRTLKLRVEAENPGQVLRPDMFVDVEIPLRGASTLSVPSEAVLDSGLKKTVFVDRGNGAFEPRRVLTGARFGDRVEILKGLMAGERVVVSGNFLLDSESRMRMASAGVAGATSECVVCDMPIDEAKMRAAGRTSRYRGRTYVFCTEECKREFDAAPERHAWTAGPEPAAAPEAPKTDKRGQAAPPMEEPMPEGGHGRGHD